ncbi:MAG: DUF2142 domain-containing protein [Lachnospiraceae bacterium]|nr:DUF2142 domain-containing protein [Lachnospiraceae bacterium]
MLKGLKRIFCNYAYIFLPIATLLCLAGFIGSYLFPNEVLDTFEVNMREEEGDEEIVYFLTGAEDELGYVMDTGGMALKGVQPGIFKGGASLDGTELIYRVYRIQNDVDLTEEEISLSLSELEMELLFEGSYDLGSCLDGQYPYLPLDQEELCNGRLYITFTFHRNGNGEENFPGLYMNHRMVKGEVTVLGGEQADMMLKHCNIYSHDTYPLLYDCRLMTFVFLAASILVCYPKRKRKKEEEEVLDKPEEKADVQDTNVSGGFLKNLNWKAWGKGCLVLAGILCLSLLCELFIFNWSALLHPYESVQINIPENGTDPNILIEVKDSLAELSVDEQKALEVEREYEKILAEYNGEEYVEVWDESLVEMDGVPYRKVKEARIQIALEESYYIKKLALSLPLEKNAGYTLRVYDKGVPSAEVVYCSIDPKLDTGVANVGKEVNALVITLLTEEEAQFSDLTLTISNDIKMEPLRILFFMVCFLFLYLIFAAGKKVWEFMVKKPQWVFAVSAFLFGSLLIGGIGTNQVSYDEYVHARSAFRLSFGSTIETTEAAMQMVGNSLPFFTNPEERELVNNYLNEMNDPNVIAPDIGHQSLFSRAETRVYYPIAAGFFLGRALHLDFADIVAFAKFGNLLCYIFVVFWAIKMAKGYDMVVALIGLLPNNIFIASALSYDGVVTSCLLFAYVLLLNEILTPKEKIKPGNTLLMLIIFVIGCLSKPVYIVMALMLLFLPKTKFDSRTKEWLFKASILVVAGLMIYNILFPTPVTGGDYQLVSNTAFLGDKRNLGTSTIGQISYIMGNPLTYTVMLLKGMFGMLFSYTLGGVPFVGYAYMGTAPFLVNWLLILAGFFAALFAPCGEKLGKKFVFLSNLMNFGVASIVFTSMYVSYTAVGFGQILGVQGRYFIPLFLPFLSCFFAPKWVRKWREGMTKHIGSYERILFGVMAAVNLSMTLFLVILAINV